jgi:hypothetical protein
VSALTDLSDNKTGNHTRERPLLVFASFFAFGLPTFG